MIVYIIAILFFLILYMYGLFGRKRRIPKGLKEIPIERGLPIIGIVNKIEKPLCNYLQRLGKKHGPIYRVRIGMRDAVVLNNFENIKGALVDNGDALAGRWKSLKHLFVTNDCGLVFIDGDVWSKQRSFVLKTLKEFGIGRSRSTEIVQDECVFLLENLDALEGKCFNFLKFLQIFTANVISKFVMSKRFTHGDPDYKRIEKLMADTSIQSDPVSNFLLALPIFEKSEWLMKFVIWVTSRKSVMDACDDLFQKEIGKHLKVIDFNSSGEDLIDRFLIKQHQMKKATGDVETFTDFQLVRNTLDLIGGGFETTSVLLTWCFMLMGMYPEVQDKVNEEISAKIGNERLPTMSDKASLDYTQAVMDEVMRISSVAPLGIFHRALRDVSVNGYFIPADTLVIPNIFACHVDHNVWERPLEFYPEHFIRVADNGAHKYRPREELILFSMGKRHCLGESLAKMEYFIFFTGLLQRFRVSLVDDESHFDVFSGKEGIIRTPEIQDFIFKRRKECRDN